MDKYAMPQQQQQPPTTSWSTSAAMRWSIIFTLSAAVQLASCASVNSNYADRTQRQFNPTASGGDQGAASSSGRQLPAAQPICTDQFVHEHEVRSSLLLDLVPAAASPGPCKTVLTAPESNVFIVRLHRMRSANGGGVHRQRLAMHADGTGANGAARLNATRSCPLSIISTSDPLKSPWKIDPCLLEDMSAGLGAALHEDPVQMLPGRLRIIWHHGGNAPNYRLIITALGKGSTCLQPGKHACLRFGSEIILCISDTLVCDGIRHCPTGNGYDSDEDAEMCLRYKKNQQQHTPPSQMGLWEQFSKELKKIIPSSSTEEASAGTDTDTTHSPSKPVTPPHRSSPTSPTTATTVATNPSEVHRTKEARERTSLTRGLSRYGPWGYLMLGMLLCGGALLMCGMWECCCRTKKPDPNGDDPVIVSTGNGEPNSTLSTQTGAGTAEPPNYDEIDPPPSYAALFPHQKSVESGTAESGTGQQSASSATTTATTTATAAAAATTAIAASTTTSNSPH